MPLVAADGQRSWREQEPFWVRLCALLVDRGIFRSIVQAFMRVGHTHEDLDAVFGVLASHIASLLEWNSPADMERHVRAHPPSSMRITRRASNEFVN